MRLAVSAATDEFSYERVIMGIQAGTTITVTFDAQQIAQLDCLLQEAEMFLYREESMQEFKKITQERVNNVFRALHAAGYR